LRKTGKTMVMDSEAGVGAAGRTSRAVVIYRFALAQTMAAAILIAPTAGFPSDAPRTHLYATNRTRARTFKPWVRVLVGERGKTFSSGPGVGQDEGFHAM